MTMAGWMDEAPWCYQWMGSGMDGIWWVKNTLCRLALNIKTLNTNHSSKDYMENSNRAVAAKKVYAFFLLREAIH